MPPICYLPRWSRRAVAVFLVLLFCTWAGFFVMGMYPLHQFNNLFYMGFLAMGCAFVLFCVWLAIFVSPGSQRERPEGEKRGKQACVCFILAVLAILTGPHRLGTKVGGMLGLELQPIRDLQHSPAVAALGKGREGAELPKEQWPESLMRTGSWPFDRVPAGRIQVEPVPGGAPELTVVFGGKGSPVVMVRNGEPREASEPENYRLVHWDEDVWLCWNMQD